MFEITSVTPKEHPAKLRLTCEPVDNVNELRFALVLANEAPCNLARVLKLTLVELHHSGSITRELNSRQLIAVDPTKVPNGAGANGGGKGVGHASPDRVPWACTHARGPSCRDATQLPRPCTQGRGLGR